ncbi:Thioredoxin-like fold [Acididesulfobacillus acetoxydans]|uniref:Thioredoxin n=1 Tax=Acididesulfobacillus acetoxydans TaxID=1561005 RepID=A0A8S0WXH1_9FIRM|nr:thioredoxin family protein [Acididesulfobacillus acetoxydans]CAA7600961.1 Thioredoxin-like fold [Acididesulfobacillus acetoxydans]CEJ08883.1 Thioredoxin [Acididesulfobacillus acetoxydans]
MKKTVFIIPAVILILVAAVFFWPRQTTHASAGLPVQAITPAGLKQKIAQDNDFFIYFYSPTCPKCLKAEPLIAKALRSSPVKLFELNVKAYPDAKAEFQVPGTPTLYHYIDHRLAKGITGAGISYQVYLDFFRLNPSR